MIKEELEQIDNRIKQLHEKRETLVKLAPILDDLQLEWSICNDHLDFDQKPHDEVIRVIAAFGGKWTKSEGATEGTINYVRDEPIGPLIIRCWCGAPPPNCRIIEEEVEVPEHFVPSRIEIRRKLVCLETENA